VLHEVTLTRAFRLGVTEVTQEQYAALVGATPSEEPDCPRCPVEDVSWSEAAAYTNARSEAEGLPACYTCDGEGADVACGLPADPYACDGWRLPTEAEWEYAARGAGASTGAYPNGGSLVDGQVDDCDHVLILDDGSTLGDLAWYCRDAEHRTHRVGGKEANALGLEDMAGNVWEWVGDGYGAYGGDTTDPFGTGAKRIKRGGSWVTPPQRLRVAWRERVEPDARFGTLGFRVARTEPPGGSE